MPPSKLETRLTLNILFLTDFSEPSEVTIPYAVAVAREYEAEAYALHVLTPVPLAYASPDSAAAIEGREEARMPGALLSTHLGRCDARAL